jgi:hypothetical protein
VRGLFLGVPFWESSTEEAMTGVGRFGLAGLSVTAARKVSVRLHRDSWHPRGRIADAMAPREGRERSTMEGAAQRMDSFLAMRIR